MEKSGTVKKLSGEYMTVSVVRDSACGDNCAACGLCKNNREMTVRLKNTDGFKVGDKILLVSDDKKVMKHSAIGYLSLTLLLIFGGIMGGALGGDWFAFGGAIAGTALGIIILRLFFADKIEITTKRPEK